MNKTITLKNINIKYIKNLRTNILIITYARERNIGFKKLETFILVCVESAEFIISIIKNPISIRISK